MSGSQALVDAIDIVRHRLDVLREHDARLKAEDDYHSDEYYYTGQRIHELEETMKDLLALQEDLLK